MKFDKNVRTLTGMPTYRGREMKRTQNMAEAQVGEMAIVDTFTKLIFGEESQYSNRELMIIQAFRNADANVVLDSHRDMGTYLRALGVGEMIKLVSRVQDQLALGEPLVAAAFANSHSSALNRRVH